MKLLVDCHCFDYKTTEGINTYIKGLYCEFVKIAQDVDFYFLAQNVDNIRALFGEASNIHYISLKSQNKVYRLLFEIPTIIKQYKIDLAHFQYTAPLIKNCKTIVTLHDILFEDYPEMFPLSYRLVKGILFKWSAKRADLLLTVSEYSRKQIAGHYGLAWSDIFVTPNAVSDDFYQIDKKVAEDFVHSQGIDKYILYVSRVEPRKNQIAVLNAYLDLALYEKGYDLVFIGRKTISSSLFENRLAELKPEVLKRIHLLNQVDYNDLKFWYKGASLFVYPALAEGFGIPPIEAGAAEIPCVCSNRTAMGDFSFFGENLVDPLDVESLNERIDKNLKFSDKMDLRRISDQIAKTYNWKTVASDLYSYMRSKKFIQ